MVFTEQKYLNDMFMQNIQTRLGTSHRLCWSVVHDLQICQRKEEYS